MDHSPSATTPPKLAPTSCSTVEASPPSSRQPRSAALSDKAAAPALLSQRSTSTPESTFPSVAQTQHSCAREREWSSLNGTCSDVSANETLGETTSLTTLLPADGVVSEPLRPIFIGFFETKRDAFLVLEKCLRGDLHTLRGPQQCASVIESGFVFVWEHDDSPLQDWDDGNSWYPVDHDGTVWTSYQATMGSGLLKKTLSVHILGRFHHIVSYYDPWQTVDGTLKAPSRHPDFQSITLRENLICQLPAESESEKTCRFVQARLEGCTPLARTKFMKIALLLTFCFVDEGHYEHLMQRKRGHWYPRIPTEPTYWHDLSCDDLFVGQHPRQLKKQMKLLLLRLLAFAKESSPSKLSRHQPLKPFSAIQNRRLYTELFRISNKSPLSPRAANPLLLNTYFARSPLLDDGSHLDTTAVENQIVLLMQELPIDPPLYGDVSRCLIGILDQVSIEECDTVRMMSMVYANQFPKFALMSNSQSLFLVACRSASTSPMFTELLCAWAASFDGLHTFHRLLQVLQHALPPDELMLHLEALILLNEMRMSTSTEHDGIDSTPRVSLVDLDHLFEGNTNILKTRSILRETVWSFSNAILKSLAPDRQLLFLRFWGPAQSAFGAFGQIPKTALDDYCMERLQHPISHANAKARLQDDGVSVSARYSLTHTVKEGDATSDHNSVFLWDSYRPLTVDPREQQHDRGYDSSPSSPWWDKCLKALGLGSCVGAIYRADWKEVE